MKPKIFIPIREESQNLPGKPFLSFGETSLWRYSLKRLNQFNVFVDTNSDELLGEIPKDPELKHITVYNREKELNDQSYTVNDLIYNFLRRYQIMHEVVIQMHITHPFLKTERLLEAYRMIDLEGDYDSIVGSTLHQSRFWVQSTAGEVPLNHNPMRLTPSNVIPQYIEENSSFYVFQAHNFLHTKNRLGARPKFFHLKFPEHLRIHNEEDWNLCKILLTQENEYITVN